MVLNEVNQSSRTPFRVDPGWAIGRAPWHVHVFASFCFTNLVGQTEWMGDEPISLSVTLRPNCAYPVTEYLEHFSRGKEVSRHLDLAQPGLRILWVEGKGPRLVRGIASGLT